MECKVIFKAKRLDTGDYVDWYEIDGETCI